MSCWTEIPTSCYLAVVGAGDADLVAVVALTPEAYDSCHIKLDVALRFTHTLLHLFSILTIDLGCLAHVSWHLHLRNPASPHEFGWSLLFTSVLISS